MNLSIPDSLVLAGSESTINEKTGYTYFSATKRPSADLTNESE